VRVPESVPVSDWRRAVGGSVMRFALPRPTPASEHGLEHEHGLGHESRSDLPKAREA